MEDVRRIWRWWRFAWSGSGPQLGIVLVLSVGSAVLLTAFPWLWQYLIDEVGGNADPVRLTELAGWMAGVGIAHGLLYVVLQGTRTVVNARIEWRARERVFGHLSRLDHRSYATWRTGDLVTRLYDDAGGKISWFLCSGIFRTYEAAMIVLVALAAMLWIDPPLALMVCAPLPLLIVAQAGAQRRLAKRYGAVQDAISSINDALSTTFGSIRVVLSAGLQPGAQAAFSQRAAAQADAEVSRARASLFVYQMYGYAAQIALAVLLLYGGRRVLSGELSLGAFVSFEGFLMTMVFPMFDVGTFVSKISEANVALKRLEALLGVPVDAGLGGSRDVERFGLRAEAVTVKEEGGSTLLEAVDVAVEPGELVAVVGEVGSGKSVLLALLAGQRQPDDGRLCLGDVPLDQVRPALLAAAIGYVPQDPVLVSSTLRDNILLGREVGEGELERALDVSRLVADLHAFPDGLSTGVGERGVTLSGGQQQRVALARALVGRPSVLILDDATAALDADTEAMFWRRLEAVLPEVSAVVVTHRTATLQRADRVVVLERGRVVQAGDHGSLLAQEGAYRRIYGRFEARARVAG